MFGGTGLLSGNKSHRTVPTVLCRSRGSVPSQNRACCFCKSGFPLSAVTQPSRCCGLPCRAGGAALPSAVPRAQGAQLSSLPGAARGREQRQLRPDSAWHSSAPRFCSSEPRSWACLGLRLPFAALTAQQGAQPGISAGKLGNGFSTKNNCCFYTVVLDSGLFLTVEVYLKAKELLFNIFFYFTFSRQMKFFRLIFIQRCIYI